MMKGSVRYLEVSLVVLVILATLGGCASSRTQGMIHSDEYRRMLEKQRAEASLEQAADKKLPEMTAGEYDRLGDQYLAQGNMDMAFIQYRKALHLEPEQIRFRYKLGYLFLQRGMWKEAQGEFQQVLRSNPTYAPAHDGLGRVFFHLGKPEEAEKHLRQSLTHNPESWQAHNYLGILFERQNRLEEAVQQFETAISLRPNESLLYNNLGTSLMRQGENLKAAQAFREAIKAGEPHPTIYNNLALTLSQLGRFSEALEMFKKSGDEPSAYYQIGCVYLAHKKYREAMEAFERTIELTPGFHVKAYEKKQQAKAGLSVASQPN